MSSIAISLPDGRVRSYPRGIIPLDLAKDLGSTFAKNTIAVLWNEEVQDAHAPLLVDGRLRLLTWEDREGKSTFWHSSAHLMAEALQRLYGEGVKFGIGPPIESGFYYDIDLGDRSFPTEDIPRLESLMIELARQKNPFLRSLVNKDAARTHF
ncbi:MAG: TGS domain-containing protein, partial [Cytophagales bacterium]|nr:TGS domain-containing protein [Cytophagales bacterium]